MIKRAERRQQETASEQNPRCRTQAAQICAANSMLAREAIQTIQATDTCRALNTGRNSKSTIIYVDFDKMLKDVVTGQ